MKSVGVRGTGSIADVYVRNAARMGNCRVGIVNLSERWAEERRSF